MHTTELANLFVIAAAPKLEPTAPLNITVTRRGRQTLRAHNAPVTGLRRIAMQPASCVACGVCNINGELSCSDCAGAKDAANASRIEQL